MKEITTAGSIAVVDRPLGAVVKRKYKQYEVPSKIFRRFEAGRYKFERWSKYLDLQDSNQKALYDYAKKNYDAVIVLKDSETGALIAIRRKEREKSIKDFKTFTKSSF